MKLSELHDEFVFLSGREDLSDDRKNFFINSGQRFLDRAVTTRDSMGKFIAAVNIDDWYVTFKGCRAIESVFVASDDDRWQLEKKELGWMMLNYTDPIADIDSDEPLYYATPILRSVPQDKTSITLSKFVGETVQTDHKHFGYNGIIWMPPTDEKLIVEVHGLFYTEELKVDEDESVWSVVYPNVLIMAALRELEIFYRNTEGAKDWTSAILVELATLEFDLIEEEIAGITQIED